MGWYRKSKRETGRWGLFDEARCTWFFLFASVTSQLIYRTNLCTGIAYENIGFGNWPSMQGEFIMGRSIA